MTATTNKDVIIENEVAKALYLERMRDKIIAFNQSSNGAILLQDKNIKGDFGKELFYKIGGSINHRDVDAQGVADVTKIDMDDTNSVKIPFKYGPYATTKEAFKRRGLNPSKFSQMVALDYADALVRGYFSYGVSALKAAISSNTEMVETASIATDGKKAISKGLRKFGDAFNKVSLLVMDSSTYFDLVDNSITEKVYEESSAVIYGGQPGTLGKPVLVTDNCPENSLLAIQKGAITISASQVPEFVAYDVPSNENIEVHVRAEGAFNVNCLGYKYKESGGSNPDLSIISASANWAKSSSLNKDTAGVLLNLS